jgi:GTP-binding protein EngB required for normal cell division
MDLRDYERDKFAIADILRTASNLVPKDNHEWQDRLRALFARLADDRFNLVVVGRFSRGKTSLMNAIMGSDRLPVGIVPLTSVITTVSYGTKEQVILDFGQRILSQEVPIESLPQYVTQQGNPGNAKGIKLAKVQLRAEILRRGFYFVDTPGLGSAIAENTRTTEAFLPEGDAFLVVTSFESPLSEEEMRFFRSVSSSARRIFVALNKQDMASQQERDDVLGFVDKQLREVFGENIPQVFSVSAREGLEAKQSKDIPRLTASGVEGLEQRLLEFLLNEKRSQFLLRMCDRVSALAQDLPQTPEAASLWHQISAMAEAIGGVSPAATVESAAPSKVASELPALHQFRSCEICGQIANAQWDFLSKYQHRLSVSHDEQRRFADDGGLCSFHTWQYASMVSSYGVCTSYPMLLERLAAWFRTTAAAGPQQQALPEKIEALLPGRKGCVLCNVRAKAEAEAITNLANRFALDETQTMNSLSAICLPHFAMLTTAVKDSGLICKIMEHEATIFERLSEDMQRYSLKFNAVRRALESEEEETAADRTMMLLAGHRNVNAR